MLRQRNVWPAVLNQIPGKQSHCSPVLLHQVEVNGMLSGNTSTIQGSTRRRARTKQLGLPERTQVIMPPAHCHSKELHNKRAVSVERWKGVLYPLSSQFTTLVQQKSPSHAAWHAEYS